MFHRVQRFLELDRGDRAVFLLALGLLPSTAVTLRIIGFKRYLAATGQPGGLPFRVRPNASDGNRVRRISQLVLLASRRGPYRASCLEESLALLWLLRRTGTNAELRIGVRKEAGQLQAHAWVEFGGRPLNDSADVGQRYRLFDRAPIPTQVKFI